MIKTNKRLGPSGSNQRGNGLVDYSLLLACMFTGMVGFVNPLLNAMLLAPQRAAKAVDNVQDPSSNTPKPIDPLDRRCLSCRDFEPPPQPVDDN